jgi:predicted DNA-binding transcriptional regulator AlpA
MDDVQNTTSPLQFEAGASLRKQMGLVTPGELASALGVSEITLQVWRQKGNGPRFTKLGKNIFYPLREIQHWTETNVLDRVRENVPTEAPLTRYKTGEIVRVPGGWEGNVKLDTEVDKASSADEIEQTLAALIEPPKRAD